MMQPDLQPSPTADSSAQFKKGLRVWFHTEAVATAAFTALSIYSDVLHAAACVAVEAPVVAGTITTVVPSGGTSLAAGAYLTLLNFEVNPGCIGLMETAIEHVTHQDHAYAVAP
jgi:hypothetical protein